jgi:hypothetical protein
MDYKLQVKILKELTDARHDLTYILFCLFRNDNPIDIFLTVDAKDQSKLNDHFVYCMREIDPDFNDPKEFFDMTIEELSVVITRKRTNKGILEKTEYYIPTYKS